MVYMSLHRFENGHFFPCSRVPGRGGAPTDVGPPGSAAEGRTVNVCWASSSCDGPGASQGMGDRAYEEAMRSVLMPIAREWAPQIVLVFGGLDAAKGDPTGKCELSPEQYVKSEKRPFPIARTHGAAALACAREAAAAAPPALLLLRCRLPLFVTCHHSHPRASGQRRPVGARRGGNACARRGVGGCRYARMTADLMTLGDGKVVVELCGGYAHETVRKPAAAVVRTLLGDLAPPLCTCETAEQQEACKHPCRSKRAAPEGQRGLMAWRDINAVVEAQRPFWKCMESAGSSWNIFELQVTLR